MFYKIALRINLKHVYLFLFLFIKSANGLSWYLL